MKASLILKSQSSAIRTADGDRIRLEAPSVVQLQIGPEQVARFERHGNDLLLFLEDGTVLTIEKFFVVGADGRNDLVFEDGAGVSWWAQYGDHWSGFDIAEINDDSIAVPVAGTIGTLSPALLAGLGLLAGGGIALAAAGGGGGSGSSTPAASNRPPITAPESERTPEDTPLRGKLLANDGDPDGNPLTVTAFAVDGRTYGPGETAAIPGIGTITIGGDGSYVFVPVADWNGTVPTITYTVSDGKGGATTSTLDIEVTSVGDVVPDDATTHAGVPVTLAVLTNDNFANADAKVTGATRGEHGSVIVNPDGTITYTPDAGYVGSDSFTYTVTSGGRTETATVTVSVGNTPPVATPEAVITPEDTPVTGNVLANDLDRDGDPLTVTSFEVGGQSYAPGATATIPGVGAVTIGGDGGYSFIPEANWNGTVPPVTYTTTDGNGGTNTANLTITVTPVEDLSAADDSAITEEDTPVSRTVATNDGTTSGGILTFVKETDPSHGTVVMNPDGSYTYTPNANYSGPDSFTYIVTDAASGESKTQTVEITVNPVEDLSAADDSAVTDEDTPVSSTVAMNDSTTSGGALTFAKETDPSHGTVVMNLDGSYTYTPNANYNGLDSFTYTVTDPSSGESKTQTVEITVNPVNDPPVTVGAIPDQADADADSVAGLDVKTFFADVDGDTLSYSAMGLPTGLTIDASSGVISGTIDHSASQNGGGVYSVTITASDGKGGSVDQSFTWTVTNPAPVANDDAAATNEDTPVSGNVLAGGGAGDVADSDPDGDALSVTSFTIAGDPTEHSAGDVVAIPGRGSFTLGSDGGYTFTPAANWNGTVPTVTYTISDGEGGSAIADLVITVNPVNDPPVTVGAIPDQADADADSVAGLDVKTFFADVDGDTLSYSAMGLPTGLTIDASSGVISGTIDHSASQNGGGVYSVTITASDGKGGSVDQSFTWTVTNPAPVANDDAAATNEDTPVSGNVLAGGGAGDVADSDPDGDALSVTSFTIAGDPTEHSAGDVVAIPGRGSFTLGSDGGYTFTPAANWNGTVPTVTYTISDGEGGSAIADLVITVNPVNDPPVILGGDQSGSVIEAGNLDDGTVVNGQPSASGTFTATDVDGDVLSWNVVGTPNTTYGAFSINSATGAWSYQLDNARPATQALKEGQTVDLTYIVRVSDGAGGSTIRNVAITITGTNDSPVANADSGSVKESGVLGGGNTATAGTSTYTGNVLTNDADVDSGEKATLSVSAISFGGSAGTVGAALTGNYGSLLLNANGTYTYTLANNSPDTQALKQGETISEVFTYTAVDVNGASSPNTLTITVSGTNDQPQITSNAAAATGDVTEQGTANPGASTTTTGTLTASDVDRDATQSWSIGTTNGTYGTIAINPATGQWTYTLDNTRSATQALNNGETGTETFTARVTDEFGAYREQVITVAVHGSNDDLTGSGDETVTLPEDGSASGTLQSYVSDVDDVLKLTGFTVDADGDGSDESYAAGSTVTLKDAAGNDRGILTIGENGAYNFTPAPNYAGVVPTVTYTIAESSGGSGSITQKLTFAITKVADAPELEANKTVNTNEDTAVSLALKTPVITDTGTGTGNNDNPERLGEITLTIGGSGASGVTLSTSGITLTPVGGKITIVLTDVDHVTNVPAENNSNGVYYLSKAQYEGLMANPLAESGKNFTVTINATSYEVDASGAILAGVTGATSTQLIGVDVQAVTDGATLSIDNGPSASATFAEDTTLDLTGRLAAALTDTDGHQGPDSDGSETYWYTIEGLPVGSIVTIGAVTTTISASTSTATSAVSTSATPPTITIKPPADYSGDLNGIRITLNSKDTDTDSTGAIETKTSSVTLDLHVTPVAGDVGSSDVTTSEDTPVNFLAGVAVTDTGSGNEVIDAVSFTVPPGWTVNQPSPSAGWSFTLTGSTATITFDSSLNEAQRESVLDNFTIKPPAHSSTDVTIALSITTIDGNTVNGSVVSDTQTVNRDVKITVTPVAEQVGTDSDGNGVSDVTMIADHAYSVPGQEDSWFALGQNYTGASNLGGGHDLITGWSDADADEFVYAVLSPTLVSDTPGDSVIGTQFRYSTDGGATWITLTYVGEPVWVPQQYLDTLQVKLPADVAGTLTIGVRTATVDYDDDADVSTLPLDPPHVSGAGVSVAISGEATLSLIKFDPVADAVTMALNGRVAGLEDTAIPLAIRTTSSDLSETFNVTISGIPNGAKIVYDGAELTISGGSVTIAGFRNSAPLTITPPANSSDDFSLTVSAVSVDGSSTSSPVSRTIAVSVTGVADTPVVTLPTTGFSTSESALDSGNHRVALSNVVTSVTSPDTDGSEIVTVRITGLAAGFAITGATMVTSGTGEQRVWLVAASRLADVSIIVPENYSGTVNFKVAGVTTENDGDSKTGSLTDVSFTVAPSPEATITTSASLVEDQITPLNLAIIHQNGDTNETLGKVYVPVGYDTTTYTLYLNGTELSAAGLTTSDIGGVTYYEIPASQVAALGALGATNLDGSLGSLNFLYEVVDPSSDGTLAAVTEVKSGTLALDATPVTDAVDASITGIAMGTATGSTADTVSGDDASPDTATVSQSGSVTVYLHVDSADTDGSEHLLRVLIEGVPDGVTVTGASQVSAGTWLLIYDGADAKSIGVTGIDLPVEFIVGKGASNSSSQITMTVQAKDEGQSATSPAGTETDAVRWTLDVNLTDGEALTPPVIGEWRYNGTAGAEDTAFTLSQVMEATVSASDAGQAYSYTVTVTDLPVGSTVSGMTLTTIGGVPTWTATVSVPAGADSQSALDALLAGISITPPPNSNDNNADFSFDAKLTASAVGGTSMAADAAADLPIVPVTDEAVITVTTSNVGEGTDSVTATIAASDPADGLNGQIVDGKLYIQVTTNGNDGGTLTGSSGDPIPLSAISGVSGVPDGNYYVVDVGTSGGSVDLTYTAADGTLLAPGDVTFTAYAQTQETGAANVATGSASGTAAVEIVNNGVTVTSQAWSGNEAASADKSNAIELSGLSVALNDNDGSESIRSILLSGVPVGFLLYVGNSAGDAALATQASNAGGDGTTNTWVLSADGTMPGYVAILPPSNWSGTVSNLALVVESGEASLSTARVDTVPLDSVVVEAVADGLTIDSTLSFGTEGQILPLNLNAAMADPEPAISTLADGSTESTTVQIKGLGEHVAFYIGDVLVTSASYDGATDTYTIAGLSQDELDALGFKQAAAALSDQDGATAGTQIAVTAWTVESANGAESDHVSDELTVSMSRVLATTGNDAFIWSGETINGRAGDDTVALRYGEDLTGAQLAARLTNIETIDLGVGGENAITDLTPDQVKAMTDSRGYLTITGSAEDHLSLGDGWQDNGDGTYTGTIAGGTAVTLAVDDDVIVTSPATPFAASSMFMSMAMAGEPEGFGLASLDSHDPAQADSQPSGAAVTVEDVMASNSSVEDLTAGLPGEDGSTSSTASTHAAQADMGLADAGPTALDEELRARVLHEV